MRPITTLAFPPLVLLGLVLAVFTAADTQTAAGARSNAPADEIARYIDDRTVIVGQIAVAEFDLKAFMNLLEGFTPGWANPDEVDRAIRKFQDWRKAFRDAGGRSIYFVGSLADDPADAPFMIVPLHRDADPQRIIELLEEHAKPEAGVPEGRFPFETTARLGNDVFAGSRSALKRLQALEPAARPELANALGAVGDAHMRVAFLATDETRRALRRINTKAADLPEGTDKILADGIVWAVFGMRTPPELRMEVVVQSRDPTSAEALHEWVASRLRVFRERQVAANQTTGGGIPEPLAGEFMRVLTPTVEGDRLRIRRLGEEAKRFLLIAPPHVYSPGAQGGILKSIKGEPSDSADSPDKAEQSLPD